VHLELAADLPSTIGERIRLQQVVVNLLVNSTQALEAIPPNEREIRVTTGREGPGSVAFSIRDNGLGIPVSDLERIFGGFFSTKASGMGIGLMICQSIVTAHGGTITALRPHVGGAEFRVVLPLVPTSPKGLARRSPEADEHGLEPTMKTTFAGDPIFWGWAGRCGCRESRSQSSNRWLAMRASPPGSRDVSPSSVPK
jgi:hypothetical protein